MSLFHPEGVGGGARGRTDVRVQCGLERKKEKRNIFVFYRRSVYSFHYKRSVVCCACNGGRKSINIADESRGGNDRRAGGKRREDEGCVNRKGRELKKLSAPTQTRCADQAPIEISSIRVKSCFVIIPYITPCSYRIIYPFPRFLFV